jgi:hypothetical protein
MTYIIAYAIAIACAVWVYYDARKRDWTGDWTGPWFWAIGTAIIWLLAFPLYLVRRRRRPVIG